MKPEGKSQTNKQVQATREEIKPGLMRTCRTCKREVEDPCLGANALTAEDPVCWQAAVDIFTGMAKLRKSMPPYVPPILKDKAQNKMLSMPKLLGLLDMGCTAIRRGCNLDPSREDGSRPAPPETNE